MQLPPTILSVDKHEKKKPPTGSKLSSAKTPTKVTQKKQKEPVKEATPEAEAEDESEGSSSEDSENGAEEDATSEPPAKPAPPPAKTAKLRAKKEKIRGLRPPRTLETTLFDRLEKMYGPDIKRMLNVQYRSVIFNIV